MYYMASKCGFQDQPNINALLACQDDVISKLSVLKHNINNIASRNSFNLKDQSDNLDNLLKIQENVLSRLQAISSKVTKISNEYTLNIEYKFTKQELESFQNNLNIRLNNLQVEVNELMITNKCSFSAPSGKVTNISLFADYRNPPISVILLLKLLKNRGYRVACISYCKNVEQSKVSQIFSKYIKANLDIVQPRQSYDIIVSIIWQKLDINDCISYDDIFNTSPMIGEIIILYYLGTLLSIDIKCIMDKMECINDDLLYQRNTKNIVNILNNKLANEIHINEERNLFLSAFVISCVYKRGVYKKINEMLKTNIDNLLIKCGDGALEVISLIH